MDLLIAVVLAVVQGLTEFLPISSSGHLVVVETLFNLQASEYLFFDVLLHLATLLAVCIFYRHRLLQLTLSLNPSRSTPDVKQDRLWVAAILVSTVVTGSIGLAIKDFVEHMRDDIWIVGVCFLGTGILLLCTRLFRKDTAVSDDFPINVWLFALIMGLVQGIAVLPGVSRSGATVCTALLLGASVKPALQYSFLMSIPAILAAAALELPDAQPLFPAYVLTIGFVTALLSGIVFLWLLVWIVKHGQLHYFAYYVIPLGIWVLWYSM